MPAHPFSQKNFRPFFPANKRNRKNPVQAESTEAAKILIFAVSKRGLSGNARAAIKRDMVKPMPAKAPAPAKCFPSTFFGSGIPAKRCSKYTLKQIPNGFPRQSPSKMPSPTEDSNSPKPPAKETPAFAKANKGIMPYADQGSKRCSKR